MIRRWFRRGLHGLKAWSKEAMTSFDVRATARELDSLLEGALIDKVYQVGERELKVKLHIPGVGSHYLVLEPGTRVHLTWRPKPSPDQPTPVSQALRSTLSGDRIERITQLGFDRILRFDLRSGRRIYIELLPKGTLAVTDENDSIERAFPTRRFRNRAVVPGETYKPPESPPDPYELGRDTFLELLLESDRDIVRTLAVDVGLGGLYAEEVLLRVGLYERRESHASEFEEELEEIYETLRDLLEQISEGDLRPTLYRTTERDYVDVTPVPLERYSEELEIEEQDTFQRALDDYYVTKLLAEKEREVREKWEREKRRLERTIERQRSSIEQLCTKAEKLRERANALYLNYNLVDGILSELRKAEREGYSLEEIKRMIQEAKGSGIEEVEKITDIDVENRRVILRLPGENSEVTVPVPIDSDVHSTASKLFDHAKELERKAERAREVLREQERELEKLLEEGPPEVKLEELTVELTKRRKKDWYERFRWFISSDGFVVIGGSDAHTNEIILRRYLEDHDILVHAHVHGAPHVVIKTKGKEVPETTLREAAIFAASYSRAWRWGLKAADVYWVTADQVDKSAEAPHGGAIIRGKRNWFRRTELKVAIGVQEVESGYRVMGGPVSAVKRHCLTYGVLEPGNERKSDVARRLFEMFKNGVENLRRYLTVDDVMRAMPPGNARLLETD
ncbi:ribosome rescue protein RqcH [Methanopyrus sp.]